MKKLLVFVPIFFLALTGCGKAKTGTIECTLNTKDAINGFELNSTYKINYTGNYIDSVNSVETISSEKEELLSAFEKQLNTTYETANKVYGGYTFDVTNKNGKVVSKADIDYSKMNLKQFTKDQPTLNQFVKDDKLLVEGIKSLYESMGATCK